MAGGRERRFQVDRVARALLAAKAEREAVEAELEHTPAWRILRRTELQRSLEAARRREQALIAALGGRASGAGERRP
jgi:hypothetical protein